MLSNGRWITYIYFPYLNIRRRYNIQHYWKYIKKINNFKLIHKEMENPHNVRVKIYLRIKRKSTMFDSSDMLTLCRYLRLRLRWCLIVVVRTRHATCTMSLKRVSGKYRHYELHRSLRATATKQTCFSFSHNLRFDQFGYV